MTKLLISLLALDIGVSLSKVYIFTWKSNYYTKKEIDISYPLFACAFYFKK